MRPRARSIRRVFRGRVAKEGGAQSLSDEWCAWIAENLLLRTPLDEIQRTLEEHGVPRSIAALELAAVERSALMVGARRVARLVRRFELVARLRREVEKIGSR